MSNGPDIATAPSTSSVEGSSRVWTFIPLHGKHGDGKFALVDAADADELNQHEWWVLTGRGNHYPARTGPVLMHRHLLALGKGEKREGDHINRDTFDNRRCNLRAVSRQEQLHNLPSRGGLSKYRGVSRSTRCKSKPWRARVRLNGKLNELGYFATEEEAAEVARAYRAEHMTHATD